MTNEPFLQRARNATRLLQVAIESSSMGEPVKLTLGQADEIIAVVEDAQTIAELRP
jgi:hypothetical protein